MTTATIFHGLFQGEHGSEENASLVSVFSSVHKAECFKDVLSKSHTDLKREANIRRQSRLPFDEIPDLYWDVRPIAFDPRTLEELL